MRRAFIHCRMAWYAVGITAIATHAIAVTALGVDEKKPRQRELVQATLDLVRGLGLANVISDDTARRRRVLDAWAHTLDTELGRP